MTPDNPLSPYERAAHALGDVMEDMVFRALPLRGPATRASTEPRVAPGLGHSASVRNAERGNDR